MLSLQDRVSVKVCKARRVDPDSGSACLCVLLSFLIVSVIGSNVESSEITSCGRSDDHLARLKRFSATLYDTVRHI